MATTMVKLYSASVRQAKPTLSIAAKANVDTDLKAVLTFADGSVETVNGKKKVGNDWGVIDYDIAKLSNKTLTGIDFTYQSSEDKTGYELLLGNITLKDGSERPSSARSPKSRSMTASSTMTPCMPVPAFHGRPMARLRPTRSTRSTRTRAVRSLRLKRRELLCKRTDTCRRDQ